MASRSATRTRRGQAARYRGLARAERSPAPGRVAALGDLDDAALQRRTDRGACTACGGYGWKVLTMRRAASRAGDPGERAPRRRPRATCLACNGTGDQQAIPPGNHDSTGLPCR